MLRHARDRTNHSPSPGHVPRCVGHAFDEEDPGDFAKPATLAQICEPIFELAWCKEWPYIFGGFGATFPDQVKAGVLED